MTPEATRALQLRKLLSKSSLAKLATLAEKTGPGDRLRHQYKYHGAHTARWAAGGGESSSVQLQNLPRGTIKDIEGALAAIRAGAPNEALAQYGPVLDVLSSCLRGAFRAPEGHKFVVGDLAQIEIRVLAWLTGCIPLLDAFALAERDASFDLYKLFASESLYHVPIEAVTKQQRQISKSAVLGCGYQLGGGDEKEDKNGDMVKTGLWGYAASMGVEMSREESHAAVQAFRAAYPEVRQFWYRVEDAAKAAVLEPGVNQPCGRVWFGCDPNRRMLMCLLPSGRRLHYLRPLIIEDEWPDGRPKTTLTYEANCMGVWRRRPTYGGHLTENLCQAVARDVLAEGMLHADEAGFTIVGHTHDEIISLEQCIGRHDLTHLINCMTRRPEWASDLILAADGYESEAYKK